MATEQELNEYSNKLNSQMQQLEGYEGQLQSIINQPVPERKFNSRMTTADQQKFLQRREQAKDDLEKIRAQKSQLRDEQIRVNDLREKAVQKRRIQESRERGQAANDWNAYTGEHQWDSGTTTTTTVVYTDSLGQPISIAPELAEERIRNYNEWAATQKSQASGPIYEMMLNAKEPQTVYKFRDIAWIEQKSTKQILPADYLNQQVGRLLSKTTDKWIQKSVVLSNSFLSKRYSFDYSSILKGVAVEPAMASKSFTPRFKMLSGKNIRLIPVRKKYIVVRDGIEYNFGEDIIQPVVLPEKYIQIGKFNIETKIPKTTIYSDTSIKKILRNIGVNNKYTSLTLEKSFPEIKLKTAGVVIAENGKIISGASITGKVGGSLRNYYVLEGEQVPINIKRFVYGRDKLPRLQEYPLRKTSNNIYLTSEGSAYFRGELKTTKGMKVSEYKKAVHIQLPKYGKRENLYSTASIVKEFAVSEGSYTLYITKLGLKDITNVNSRAIGKVTKVEGFSKVMEPKYYNTDISDYKVNSNKAISVQSKQVNIKAVSLVQGFKASAISRIEKTVIKRDIMRVAKLKGNNIETWMTYPKMAGGLGLDRSIYYGQGTLQSNQGLSTGIFSKELLIPLVKSINKLGQLSISKPLQKPIIKETNKTLNTERAVITEKSINKYQLKSIQKPILKSINKPINKVSINQPKIQYRLRIRPEPKEKLFVLSNRKKSFLNIYRALGFKTFIKRKGKVKWLPGIRERGSAIRFGESEALSSLAATFGIKKTNVKISKKESSYIPSKKLFRDYRISKSKRIQLKDIYIQRRGKRLSNPFEIKEIQLARMKI